MTILQAIILGIVEGLTEFLPVSSTGHLTIAAKMMGLSIDDPSVTAFTAVIQVGAIFAVVIYFWTEIVLLVRAWARGLFNADRRTDPDYRLAWLVLIGSLPIVVVGFLARDIVSGPLRSLWVVAFALIIWGGVMLLAEAVAKQDRGERELNLAYSLIIGFAQCLALIPGVSRSGATISVGLMRGLDRVTATRLAFLLGIPALLGAGVYELPSALKTGKISLVCAPNDPAASNTTRTLTAFIELKLAPHQNFCQPSFHAIPRGQEELSLFRGRETRTRDEEESESVIIRG